MNYPFLTELITTYYNLKILIFRISFRIKRTFEKLFFSKNKNKKINYLKTYNFTN